jgi:hypothetical protein
MFKMSGKNKFVRIQKFLLDFQEVKKGDSGTGLIGLIILCLHAVKNVCPYPSISTVKVIHTSWLVNLRSALNNCIYDIVSS